MKRTVEIATRFAHRDHAEWVRGGWFSGVTSGRQVGVKVKRTSGVR